MRDCHLLFASFQVIIPTLYGFKQIPGINVCNNLEELEEEHANFLLECFQWDVLKERIKKSAKHVPKNMFDVCFKLVNLVSYLWNY